MPEIFRSSQSHNSMLMSILFNIMIIIFICVNIKIEGKRYLPIKVIILLYILISTIALFVQL